MDTAEKVNFDDAFHALFEGTTGSGEEELLKIASTYSRQLSSQQIKAILLLYWIADLVKEEEVKNRVLLFIEKWLELKQYNNSASFVMKALDSISLRKFLGENSIKANIEK